MLGSPTLQSPNDPLLRFTKSHFTLRLERDFSSWLQDSRDDLDYRFHIVHKMRVITKEVVQGLCKFAGHLAVVEKPSGGVCQSTEGAEHGLDS